MLKNLSVTYVYESCKLVLLTFLKKELVEFLSDCVLTLDRKKLEFLS